MSTTSSATATTFWFGTRAVDFENGTNTGAQLEFLDESAEFATRTFKDGSTVDYTGTEWQQFLAFSATQADLAAFNAANANGIDLSDGVNTALAGQVDDTGDLRVGEGVDAYNIADLNGGRIVDVSGLLDDADDPVRITGLGKAGGGKLDGASIDAADTGNRVMFSNDLGFGLIGGAGFDPNGNAARINNGESIDFEIRQDKVLLRASFTVKVLNEGSTAVLIDSDGATIRDTNGDAQGGFVQDESSGELYLGHLVHGTKVTIDYVNQTILFDDTTAFDGDTTGFFAAFTAGGSKHLTLGSVVDNQVGWSADNLVLVTDVAIGEPTNQAPLAQGFAGGTGAEDSDIAGQVNATDPDGDTLAYAIALGDGPAHGNASVDGMTGAFLYTPDADFNGGDSFVVTISDGNGGTVQQVVSIAVAAVNDDPTVTGDSSGTGDEDTTIAGDLDAEDLDGDIPAFSILTAAAHGSASIDATTGAWEYVPDADFNGTDSFVVLVEDGQGGSVQQVVGVTVAPVNDAPTVSGDTGGTIDEDGAIIGDLDALDVDGDSVAFSVLLPAAHGSAFIESATGLWNYIPVPDFNGTDAFTVLVSDGQGGQVQQVVSVIVTAVNDDPVVSGDTGGTIDEDGAIIGDLDALDVDGDSVAFSVLLPAAHGSAFIESETGLWNYIPAPDFNGTDAFTVLVSDGQGGQVQQVVSVIVTAVNDDPAVSGDTGGTIDEDGAIIGDLDALDVDGDSVAFSVLLPAAHGSAFIESETGLWNYIPAPDFNGSDAFTVLVSDGQGGQVQQVVSVTVNAVNDDPTVSGDVSGTGDENTAITGNLVAFDVDGDTPIFSVLTPSIGQAFVNASGQWIYVPPGDFNGTDSFTVLVSDGQGGSVQQVVSLTVAPVNDAPTVANAIADQTVEEDTAWSFALAADAFADVDAPSLTYTASLADGSALPSWLSFDSGTRSFAGTPPLDFNGTVALKVTVSDGALSVSDSFDLVVAPVNDAPTISGDASGTGDEDTTITGDLDAADVDGDTLAFGIQANGAHGTASIDAAGGWRYVPDADFHGTDSFVVLVEDGQGGSVQQVVSVTVNPVNDDPTVSGDTSGTGDEDTTITGDLDATDVDGDTLTFNVLPGKDANGRATIDTSTGAWSYVPHANFNGMDTFRVRVSDGHGGIDTQVVTITVNPVNDAPTVAKAIANQTINEDTAWSFAVGDKLFADVDGPSLTYTASLADGSALPSWLSFDPGTRSFAGTPPLDFSGTIGLKVTASDGALSVSDSFDLVVTPVNDAPVVANAIADQSVNEDTAWSFAFASDVFADVDGPAALSYAATLANGDPLPGWLSFDGGTRTFSGTPPLNFNGTIGLKVTASDGALSVSDTFDLVVQPVADPIAPINLDSVALGTGGFKVFGENASDFAGYSVSSIGDLNGDGKAELLIGAYQNDAGGGNAGAAYVVWGKSDGTAVNLDAVAAGSGGFKVFGETASDFAGYSVSSIGDLNGDGKAELLIGAYQNDTGGVTNNGAAYVVWGKSTGTAVNLDAVAAGTGGFKVFGETANDFAGRAVSSIGDLNGDGKPELLIGAHQNDAGATNNGAAYVVWGKSDGTAVDLDAVAAGTGGFKVFGETASDFAGWSVSSIGDLNGDGKAELLIGAYQNDPVDAGVVLANAGAAYVVWGKSDGTAVNLDAVAAGNGGFKVFGETASDFAGYSVSSIGDLNGDGKAELLIGAYQNDTGGVTNNGAAYVVWGKSTGTAVDLDAVAAGTGGFKVFGEAASDWAGFRVSSIGDLNGDGRQELLIGATQNDTGGLLDSGAAYVVWGKADGAAVDLDAVAAGTGGFKVFGENADDLAGISVSAIGDLNGDGRPELLVGAYQNDAGGVTDNGAAYVVYSQADWIGSV